jgi:hypothetical protein
MSSYLHVDSTWRDRLEFPNPAEFIIPLNVVDSWRTVDRTVYPVDKHCVSRYEGMVHTVELLNLTVPDTAVISTITNATFNGNSVQTSSTISITDAPFIYVALQNTSENTDKRLTNTLEGGVNSKFKNLADAVFVVYYDKTRNGWVHFESGMTQSYRINFKREIKFRLFDNTGQTLQITDTTPPTFPIASQQVSALFDITPYVRDDRYDKLPAGTYKS